MASDVVSEIVEAAKVDRRAARERWSQVLAVGNGGGALLMGGALKDADGIWWLVELPSACLFVAGLIACGVGIFATERLHTQRFGAASILYEDQRQNPEAKTMTDEAMSEFTKYMKKWDVWHDAKNVAQSISAILWGSAVIWPVFMLSTYLHWPDAMRLALHI